MALSGCEPCLCSPCLPPSSPHPPTPPTRHTITEGSEGSLTPSLGGTPHAGTPYSGAAPLPPHGALTPARSAEGLAGLSRLGMHSRQDTGRIDDLI